MNRQQLAAAAPMLNHAQSQPYLQQAPVQNQNANHFQLRSTQF